MGRAIADYWNARSSESRQARLDGRVATSKDEVKTKKADRLRVFSPMFEEDEISLTTLFRKYKAMPEIERKALDMATGKTLDVGAGSGCHSFQMQYKDTIGEPFDWLYIDANTLKEKAAKNGYVVEVVAEGEHYDYLARIAKKIC